MLRPNLAVADRSMNDFLRRKSLPGTVIHRLRPRIDLVGARNTALQNLVAEVAPPLVAELLGYS
jgi:hypothetical protein